MPRKRGVARYLRDTYKAGRLAALRQSPRSGFGSDEGEKKKEKNPDTKRAGTEETGLFEMVNRKRRGRRIGQRLERHRVSGNALVSRPSARLGAPFCTRYQFARESRDPGATRRAAAPLGPGSRCARPGHESGARPRARLGAPSARVRAARAAAPRARRRRIPASPRRRTGAWISAPRARRARRN
jgi:hypothetical protein